MYGAATAESDNKYMHVVPQQSVPRGPNNNNISII
jgi:hypothetical protein